MLGHAEIHDSRLLSPYNFRNIQLRLRVCMSCIYVWQEHTVEGASMCRLYICRPGTHS